MNIKRKIRDEYILPVMTYGCETWALNNAMVKKLAVAQRKMERVTLTITLRDRKRSTWIRQETGVSDIVNANGKSTDGQVTQHGSQIIDGPLEQRRLDQKTASSKNTMEG